MSAKELWNLLEAVDDTRELVLRPGRLEDVELLSELFVAWSAARAEANLALDAWGRRSGAEAYAVYRAAEDRADAAEDALALAAASQRRPLAIAWT